ncbi:unnamed protein product [Clavelina lepadiformis]|uniref:Uncharacterized protein n=1 Tax=Clavelina lepadiformis TaxID=159417 RepID=A0ABP0FUK8_CLALP
MSRRRMSKWLRWTSSGYSRPPPSTTRKRISRYIGPVQRQTTRFWLDSWQIRLNQLRDDKERKLANATGPPRLNELVYHSAHSLAHDNALLERHCAAHTRLSYEQGCLGFVMSQVMVLLHKIVFIKNILRLKRTHFHGEFCGIKTLCGVINLNVNYEKYSNRSHEPRQAATIEYCVQKSIAAEFTTSATMF